MLISYLGHSCFKIQTKPKRGEKEVIIFLDPFDAETGLKPPQGRANIVTVSHHHHDHDFMDKIKGEFFTIDSAGEYSINGINILGLESFHDQEKGEQRGRNNIFIIESEDLKICHLGDLGHELDEKQIEDIGEVDVLMIPVGGNYTIDAKTAHKIATAIEPALIIPMHYKVPNLKIDIVDETEFLELFGAQNIAKESRLNLKKKDLKDKENNLVLMEIAN